MPRRNTYRTGPPRPPTPPRYHPTTPDDYNVVECGDIGQWCGGLGEDEITLDAEFSQFKIDLQKIVTKLVDRIEALEERIGDLESRVCE
jgi:hypothetical protein